eukprot:gene5443-10923_t
MMVSVFLILLISHRILSLNSFLFSNSPTLVLVDGFSEYLSGYCREYCEENKIKVVELLSPYMWNICQNQGRELPVLLRAPVDDEDIIKWALQNQLLYISTDNTNMIQNINDRSNDPSKLYIISESDSGVSTAEKMAAILNLPGNGISPQLRNKFLSNVKAQEAGLPVVKQCLATSESEAISFVTNLWKEGEPSQEQHHQQEERRKCVVKPYRGVASDGVFLCHSEEEVSTAFKTLFKQPKFGGGINDAVLIQEYADGQEYAVDTVACNGVIKVVALWKYHKLPANGAPFVYQCTELLGVHSAEQLAVCQYCIDILHAQGLTWGPTHTEIKFTSNGPRLIEINARWHAQHFPELARACLGYDAVGATLDAVFHPERFHKLNKFPTAITGAGRIIHLISSVEGTVTCVNHLDEINTLASTRIVDVDPEVGGEVVKTVDIRTDAGYIVQFHEDVNVVQSDFDRIVSLQSTMFVVG